MDVVTEIDLFSCENNGVDIQPNRNPYDVEYADDVLLLSGDSNELKVIQ